MEEDNSVDLRVQEGLSRIEELDRILKAKVEREKQVSFGLSRYFNNRNWNVFEGTATSNKMSNKFFVFHCNYQKLHVLSGYSFLFCSFRISLKSVCCPLRY